VTDDLKNTVPQQLTGCRTKEDIHLAFLAPWSPDLTLRDNFNNTMFALPLPKKSKNGQ
jgi:hypothetical protein